MMSPAMTSALPVDPVFHLILDAPRRRPGPGLPRRLTGLFKELASTDLTRPAEEIEDLIWALWTSHKERVAEETMAAAIDAMASGALQKAKPLLDHLVAKYPDWAEAWNRRATLAFIEKRDADSLLDIGETLKVEPRHFGAISGFGDICLRHGRLNEARAAFQIALSINPHLEELHDMLENLSPRNLMLH
jgi:tetratricopeptide (TPR) repeat protein